MRHGNLRRKLGVRTAHRTALLRNLVRSLVLYKRIETTVAKAKEASAFSDNMVELAKKNTLHSRRLMISRLRSVEAVDALIKEIAPLFKDRQGGYTRVLKLGTVRNGDSAPKAILEFTVPLETPAEKREKARAKKAAAKKDKAEKAEKTGKAEKAAKKEKAAAEETKKPKARKKEETETKEAPETQAEEKKEGEKKGGFIGKLRKFLKGDE